MAMSLEIMYSEPACELCTDHVTGLAPLSTTSVIVSASCVGVVPSTIDTVDKLVNSLKISIGQKAKTGITALPWHATVRSVTLLTAKNSVRLQSQDSTEMQRLQDRARPSSKSGGRNGTDRCLLHATGRLFREDEAGLGTLNYLPL